MRENITPLFISLGLSGYSLSAIISVSLGMQESPLLAIIYRAIMLALSLLIIFNNILIFSGDNGKKKVKFSYFIFCILFLFFVFSYSYRMAWDFQINSINTAIPSFTYYVMFYLSISIPCLSLLTTNSFNVNKAFNVLIIMLFISVVANIIFGANDYLLQQFVEVSRLKNQKLNPISFGHLCASLLIMTLYYKLFKSGKLGWIGTFAILCSVLGMLLANSKGPILSFFLVLMYMFHFRFPGRIILKLAVVFISILLLLGAAILLKQHTSIDVVERFTSAFSSTEVSSTSRLTSYSLAIKQFLENPILGHSLVVWPAMGYPHNIIIEVLMALGIVGATIFISMVCYGLHCANYLIKFFPDYGWPGLLFMQYFLGAQTSGAIWNVNIFWFFLCLVVVVYKIALGRNYNEKNNFYSSAYS